MSLRQIEFKIDRTILAGRRDVALLREDEDAAEEFARAVLNSVATEVEVTAGGVTLHLAAWLDPEHWSTDWSDAGVEDGRAFLASLVAPYERST